MGIADLSTRHSLHHLAQLIADGVAGEGQQGPEFFDQLTEKLSESTGADFAFIARVGSQLDQAETLSFFGNDEHLQNISYELEGTPCFQAIVGEYCVFPSSVAEIFPEDEHLKLMGAHAYLGTKLSDRSGNAIGLMAAIFRNPIEEHEFFLTLLRIFAVPAEMELLRRREQRAHEQLETRLNSILAIANEAIIATDNNSDIILFNEGAEQIFGYTQTEVIGNSVNLLIPEQLRKKHNLQMKQFLDSAEISRLMTQRNGDIMAMRKDGQVFPAEASITKTQTDDGDIVTVVLRDISERRQSERAIQSATRMQTLGNLAAGLAHDFNNILTLIRGSLDLVSHDSCSDVEKTQYLEVASKATDRGAELVSRLLAFGRPRTLVPEAINPAELINQLMEMLQVTLGEHIEVRFEKDSGNCKVFVDPSQLENAIVNLSFNARDAMESGGRLVIALNCVNLDSGELLDELDLAQGHYACIKISDTGAGMTEEIRKSALEPFYSTKMDSGGSGLGLSMVLGFVRSANGAVRIESEIGKGTSIELYLPVHQDEAQPDNQESRPAGGGETILIVEDQPDVRELAVLYASTLGYRVYEAEDGHQALALIEQHPEIDLLFTDYQLPGGISGLMLAEQFDRLKPAAKTLISSGYDTQHIDLAKYPLLPKPYSLATFAKYLRNVLDD